MNNFKLFTITYLICTLGILAKAQKVEVIEGDETLAFLKGEKEFNIKFQYDGLLIGNRTEAVYIKEKKEGYDKKSQGKGDDWEALWNNNKKDIYEPTFEKNIKKGLKRGNLDIDGKVSNLYVAKFTIVVKLRQMETGYASPYHKENPFCSFEILWTETNSGKVIARAKMDEVQGEIVRNAGFDLSGRMTKSYEKAGTKLGVVMNKAINAKD